jgi:hypothetical protein
MKKTISIGSLLLLSALSCGQDRANIILEVQSIQSSATAIDAKLKIGDDDWINVAPFMSNFKVGTVTLLFSYPVGKTGPTVIALAVRDKDNCTIGHAEYNTTITALENVYGSTAFTPTKSATGITKNIYSIWGTAKDDIWAVGQSGNILHWDGYCWLDYQNYLDPKKPIPNFAAIDGTQSNDIWMAGDEKSVFHWDGVALTTPSMFSFLPGSIQSVRAFAPKDVWMTGYSGDSFVLYRWNGSAWFDVKGSAGSMLTTGNYSPSIVPRDVTTPEYNDKLFAIAGTNTGNMFLAGTSRNDSSMSLPHLPGLMYYNLANMLDPKFDYRTSSTGGMYTNDLAADYQSAWTAGANDYWFGVSANNKPTEGPTLVHWDGMNLIRKSLGANPKEVVRTLWGVKTGSGYDMWVLTYDYAQMGYKLYRNRGTQSYEVVTDSVFSGKVITAIWGSAANDVWFVGLGGLRVHWDGTSFTNYP